MSFYYALLYEEEIYITMSESYLEKAKSKGFKPVGSFYGKGISQEVT